MQELSLNILDVAENSVRAGAHLVRIAVAQSRSANSLVVTISDDGCGMTPEQVRQVTDPFFTTRTTRKVGLGVPFFKMSAEMTGGSFSIDSAPGEGTTVTARYVLDSIDRMPLGDMKSTFLTLVQGSPRMDFVYRLSTDKGSFEADTRAFRAVLGDVPLDAPEVLAFLGEFLEENAAEIADGPL